MVSRIGGSFYQPSSFNKYEKQQQHEEQDDTHDDHQHQEPEALEETSEDTPFLYASTLFNITDPGIRELSPEAKIKHTFSDTRHAKNQEKAIESLMTSFNTIKTDSKKEDIASLIFAATKQLSGNRTQASLCKALEELQRETKRTKIQIKATLGFINLIENNANAIRLLKNKAIYLDTVQELNMTQRRLFQSLTTNIEKTIKNTNLLKELIRVIKSTIYLGNETTQKKGLLLIHNFAKALSKTTVSPTFTAFMLTSMEELKHLMKDKENFQTLKKAFEQDIITLSKYLS